MVIVSERDRLKQRVRSKKWLFFTTTLGFTFIFIPIMFIFFDPIMIIAKYYLRLENGTMLNDLMTRSIAGPRIYTYLFNVTNAKEFTTGKDEKLKLDEVGPFVYQEYRSIHDLRIDSEIELMSYTPRLWAEFIPEESIADPKNVYVTMPNIPLLLGADMISKYPFFVRNMFNIFVTSIHSKAMVDINAHAYLWGYTDPLIKYSNTILPGLFYFNSSGLLERLYDVATNYTIEIGTNDKEKFSVKKVKKWRHSKEQSNYLMENTQTFSNAYEGAAFPPGMTPDMPLYIYRHSFCKLFRLQYTGNKKTEYGSEAFVYDIANDTFNDHQLCDSKGWCPDGLMNFAPCYKNFQIAVSRGHFFGADPRLLEQIEGMKPDKKLHSSEIIIEPRIGIALSGYISGQLNLVLGDLAYNAETKPFKDCILPVSNFILKSPELPSVVQLALVLIYTYGPYILLAIKIICVLLGLGLLAYSTRILYLNWVERPNVVHDTLFEKSLMDGYVPINVWLT